MSIPLPGWTNFLDAQLRPIDRRKKQRKAVGFEGKKTKLSVNGWLELIFQYNELRSIQRYLDPDVKPFTDFQILHNFKLEFGGKNKVKKGGAMVSPGNSVLSGAHSIRFKRSEYRRGQLYAGQVRPFLMAFKYFEDGNVIKDESRIRPKYPSFKECQEMCITAKIADPRFFTVPEMERIHQHIIKEGIVSEWRFPTTNELKNLSEMLPIDPYRSVLTYDLHKKENPHNKPKTPKEDVVQTNKEIDKLEKESLEERRRATQKFLETFNPDAPFE